VIFGGLFFWIIKGFKTSLKNELGDRYLLRNFLASILIILTISILITLPQIEKQYLRKKTKIELINDKNGKVSHAINEYGDTVKAEALEFEYNQDGSLKSLIIANGDTISSKKFEEKNYKHK